MSRKRNDLLMIEDAELRFLNFSGAEGQYNPKGTRNFCVILSGVDATKLANDGWNVRLLKPKDDSEEPVPYMQVAVRFDNFPPKIVLINSTGKRILKEEQVNILDWADIETVDLTISPHHWNIQSKDGEKSGIKAYLKDMYVVIREDEWEKKYADVPDSAANSLG